LAILTGACHVDDARNLLVAEFLKTDCKQLIFVDADLRWEAKDIIRLAERREDVVGGTYPRKQASEDYAVILGDAKEKGDVLSVDGVPTGFLKISRYAIEALAEKAEKYRDQSGGMVPVIFERAVVDGVRFGGDINFCRKWREMGGEVFLLPDLTMEHTGSKTWKGNYEDHLMAEKLGGIRWAIESIRRNRVNETTFVKAYAAAGNPFVADPTFYLSLMHLKGNVLECGSGLSTLYMAANGCEVYCLEHSREWAQRLVEQANEMLTDEESSRIHIIRSDLVDGWYSRVPDVDFDGMVVDGPPRALGNRALCDRMLPRVKGMVITDDGFTDIPGVRFERVNDRVHIGVI